MTLNSRNSRKFRPAKFLRYTVLTGSPSLQVILTWLGKPGKESSWLQCISEFQRLPFLLKNLPWLSKELTKSILSRNMSYKCAKRSGAPQHLSYKQNRNKDVKVLRKTKRNFFRGLNTTGTNSRSCGR